jgi:hypothetical protein
MELTTPGSREDGTDDWLLVVDSALAVGSTAPATTA